VRHQMELTQRYQAQRTAMFAKRNGQQRSPWNGQQRSPMERTAIFAKRNDVGGNGTADGKVAAVRSHQWPHHDRLVPIRSDSHGGDRRSSELLDRHDVGASRLRQGLQ
jgi:hypothetical protein